MKSKPYDNVTVAALRAAGWKVNMRHFRRYLWTERSRGVLLMRHQFKDGAIQADTLLDASPDERLVLATTGGETQCYLTTPGGQEFTGNAQCSLKDHYCHRIGRRVSLRRALEDYLRQDPEAHAKILFEVVAKQTARMAPAPASTALAAG